MIELHLRYHTQYYFDPEEPLTQSASIIIFLLSLLTVSIVALCFLRWDSLLDPHDYLYNTSLSPNEFRRKVATLLAMGLHVLIGLLATVQANWNIKAWVAYFFASVAFSIYIWVFQINKRHALFGSCCAFFFFVVYLQKLFHLLSLSDIEEEEKNFLTNMVGCELGWSTIWGLSLLGQCLVHDAKFISQKNHTPLFFVVSGLSTAAFIFFNLRAGTRIIQMVDFLLTVGITLCLFIWNKLSKSSNDVHP
jgi:hypothetical protein